MPLEQERGALLRQESKGFTGYPLSRAGRKTRAEKFFGATAIKNVLGRCLPRGLAKQVSESAILEYRVERNRTPERVRTRAREAVRRCPAQSERRRALSRERFLPRE